MRFDVSEEIRREEREGEILKHSLVTHILQI